MMSVKVKLILDTVDDNPMEGYMSSLDAYRIRDEIYEAMYNFADTKKEKKELYSKFYDI